MGDFPHFHWGDKAGLGEGKEVAKIVADLASGPFYVQPVSRCCNNSKNNVKARVKKCHLVGVEQCTCSIPAEAHLQKGHTDANCGKKHTSTISGEN